MIANTLSKSVTRLLPLALLFLLAGAASVQAGNPPDSTDIIGSLLPDSLDLDGKVVYVDFWASWCAPCRQSFPWMQELYDRLRRRGLEIVAVSVDTDHSAALKFLKQADVTFPVLYDSTGTLAKQYGLEAMPTSFVYGRDGRLVATHRGFHKDEADSLEMAVVKLLGEGESK